MFQREWQPKLQVDVVAPNKIQNWSPCKPFPLELRLPPLQLVPNMVLKLKSNIELDEILLTKFPQAACKYKRSGLTRVQAVFQIGNDNFWPQLQSTLLQTILRFLGHNIKPALSGTFKDPQVIRLGTAILPYIGTVYLPQQIAQPSSETVQFNSKSGVTQVGLVCEQVS